MLDKFTKLTPELYEYVLAHRSERDSVLAALIEETGKLGGWSMMQIAPEQGAFLTTLARIMNAKSAVEVGTFTGYSAICIARGLAPGGKLLCCDVSEEWTKIACDFWERAGVADRIRLETRPATETLRALPEGETIDFAFIDADKTGYDAYFERCLQLLRTGGLIAIDNTLWGGAVARPADSEDTAALQALNAKLHRDERIDLSLLPIGDGLTLASKR